MSLVVKSEHRCFGGVQGFYEHESRECKGPMRFGVFMPPVEKPPVVYVLAGLECNEQTFATKAGAQRIAAELGLALVMPDTSPRTARFPGDDASWDFGQAASFYVDATVAPWSQAYRMRSYVTGELRTLVESTFPVARDRRGIMGHSVGGHGALTIALSAEDYTSVSAIAPVVAPSRVPWGMKAFTGYLGEDRKGWEAYDATALVAAGKRTRHPIRIDQGSADKFLVPQLKPELFAAACKEHGQELTFVLHQGFDHGYYFISTIVELQLRHHATLISG
jgi:S-formylglutathione hydrolase